jgi:hypothetical protein
VSYLGVPVSLLDRKRYEEIEFYDLCQLVVVQTEEAMQLTRIMKKELAQLDVVRDQLDMMDEFNRFQMKIAYLEFHYVMTLRWLQLARWHDIDMICVRFYGSQTKAIIHNRLVHFMNIEAELRNKASRAGISVDDLRAKYL